MNIRPPVVAGQFYPEDPRELKETIQEFLDQQPKDLFIPQKIRALVVPHAGYIYSGPVAAAAYQTLRLSRFEPQKIVLIGPSHHFPIADYITSSFDQWKTPLGKVPQIKVTQNEWTVFDLAFMPEHSLEVQLPFLQTILSNFEIFPILINNISLSETLARKIKSLLDEKTLIIVSSDLSHYNPLAVAQKIDQETQEIILQLKTAEAESIDACGAAGILTLMHLAKDLQWQRKLISYATSYDSSNYKDEVVGYGSFLFYE